MVLLFIFKPIFGLSLCCWKQSNVLSIDTDFPNKQLELTRKFIVKLSNFSWEWEKSKNNVTNWPMAIADVKCHCIDFIRSHNSIKKNSIDMATTTWYLRAMTSKYITSSWRNKMLRFTKSSYSHNSTIC